MLVDGDRVSEVSALPILDGDATVIDVTGLVVVVHVEGLAFRLGRRADGAAATLSLEHGLVVVEGDPVLPLQVAGSERSLVLR